MPELPEVENTRRYLIEAGLPTSSFQGADISWPKSVRTPPLEDFVLGLLGATVKEVNRRGKYLLLQLSREEAADGETQPAQPATMILHLGMTGGLRVQASGQAPHPLVRHTFYLRGGGVQGGRELRFIDGRKFGKLWLTPDPDQVLPPLGPDPLGEGFTADALTSAIGHRNAPIKAMLLEQAIVAGMGNLYADESLYLGGINPTRPASSLSEPDIERLRNSIVAAFSTSLARYDQARQEQWPDPPMGLEAWSIPRKSGAPCPRCGAEIVGIRVRARGTYFCPGCQPP